MPKLRHIDNPGDARFVTFSCFQWHPYLSTAWAKNTVLQGLAHLRTERNVSILGWVLMPEHVHLVLRPPEGARLGDLLGRFKSWTSRQILNSPGFTGRMVHRNDGKRALWQRRCYDHNCRTPQEVRVKIEYCHKNPVRRSLVENPSKWLWSSYNWYSREGPVVLEIDGFDL